MEKINYEARCRKFELTDSSRERTTVTDYGMDDIPVLEEVPFNRRIAVLRFLRQLDPSDVYSIVEITDTKRTTVIYYQSVRN